MSLRASLFVKNEIHFGKFKLKENPTFYQILKSIVLPSNFYNKITIIEGWSKSDLNLILLKNFETFHELNYEKDPLKKLEESARNYDPASLMILD